MNKDDFIGRISLEIEKYIEYMLTILIKLPRTEKFSIGTEVKKSMYEMLKCILLASKVEKRKRLELFNIVDSNIYYQRICIRIMYNNQWIDMKKYKYSNELTKRTNGCCDLFNLFNFILTNNIPRVTMYKMHSYSRYFVMEVFYLDIKSFLNTVCEQIKYKPVRTGIYFFDYRKLMKGLVLFLVREISRELTKACQ